MSKVAIILCGGRGRRLGSTGNKQPKAMARVIGYPIIWYSIMRLHAAGFRHFILPLGYRGEQIQAYIDRDLAQLNARIDGIQTGEDSEIGKRVDMVRHLLTDENFLLVNGDCLFDFDIDALYSVHYQRKSLATMTSCKIISPYGLIVVQDKEVVSFTRDSLVKSISIEHRDSTDRTGYINAGVTLINKGALDTIDLQKTMNFEADLFTNLIEKRRANHHIIEQYWFAIETQKDLEIVNSGDTSDSRCAGAIKLRDDLLRGQAALEIGFEN